MAMTKKRNKKKHKISMIAILCLFFAYTHASGVFQTPPDPQPASSHKKPTQIYVEQADSGMHDQLRLQDVQILYWNVVFRHDSTFMYCDSAYLYMKSNNLEAFGNVRMEQGDTLFVYGDYLKYDGNTEIAMLRDNVRMENNNVTLFTDSLNYDRKINIGYFLEGGMIVDEENELTSVYGQYSPGTKEAFFKQDVKLTNPRFVLTSDTLKYYTNTKIAIILGPSVIESDSGTIYSDFGWYNTVTEDSRLYNRSQVLSKDRSKILIADSIYYNRMSGFTEAFGNMFLNDTIKKVILNGNYGYFDDMNNKAMATDSAMFIEYSQVDSLFLHADTLLMTTIGENEREVKAYYGVRFYRSDIQGLCDSMQFNTQDSILYLYKEPILWNTGYQMLGDTIKILFNDSTIDKTYIIDRSFAIEKIDSTYFNQIKGRNITSTFIGGEPDLICIEGNVETIFFPSEKNGSFIGMNQTESSFLNIKIKNRRPHHLIWWPQPTGKMVPLPDLKPDEKFLKGFIDFDYLRPYKKEDIFIKTKRKEEDIVEPPKVRRREQ